MAEALHQRFEIHGDEGLVLDDQDVGRDLGGQLAARFLDQRAQGGHVDVENAGSVVLGEALERHQQERLTGLRRDVGEPLSAGRSARRGRGAVDRDRIPDLCEQTVERDPRTTLIIDNRRILDQGLQGGAHVGIAGGLVSRQSSRIATQKRQVLGNRLDFSKNPPE